jgi:hypothetical protein
MEKEKALMAEAPKKTTKAAAKAPAKARKTAATSTSTAATGTSAAATGTSAAAGSKASAPTHEQIAQLANRFWVERGRRHGHAEEDWLRAEAELRKAAS